MERTLSRLAAPVLLLACAGLCGTAGAASAAADPEPPARPVPAQLQPTARPPERPDIADAPSPDPDTAAQRFTLANGMSLIVKPDRRSPTAVQMLWVRVGSVDEVDGTSGVAHVLEHMMFKGTKTLKPGEFSRRVAALGGRENAFTTRDYTGYYQQIPADRLEAVMRLEADRFAHNQWPDDEFRRELEVVKEERRLRTDDQPRAQLGELQNAAVFNVSPYHRPVVGWMTDLDAMTPDDARAFHRRWYVPANAAVVVVGDVDVRKVRALAEKLYGTIPASAVPARKPRDEPPQRGIRRLEFKAPAEQAYVSMAWRIPQAPTGAGFERNDERDPYALLMLSAVLDGYPGARLDRALTQGPSRVADSVGAYSGLFGRGPQLFYLEGVPAQGQGTETVEAALRAQIARVAKEGVSEAELARVKTQLAASETYKLDSVIGQARELGARWVQDLPLDADRRLIERLRAVTPAEVQAVAGKYFGDDQLTVATLRPLPPEPGRKRPAPPPGAELR